MSGLESILIEAKNSIGQGPPVWNFTDNNGGENFTAYQSINSAPGVAVGDIWFSDVDYEGSVTVEQNNTIDHDFVGVVFAFQVKLFCRLTLKTLFKDNRHFYLLSSTRKGGYNWWGWPSSWALKRISSTFTSTLEYSRALEQALGGEISVPGHSEVLWKENLPPGTGKGFLY